MLLFVLLLLFFLLRQQHKETHTCAHNNIHTCQGASGGHTQDLEQLITVAHTHSHTVWAGWFFGSHHPAALLPL